MRKLITAAALAAFAFTTVAAAPVAPTEQQALDGIDFEIEVAKGETVSVEGPSGTGGTTALRGFFGVGATDETECGQQYENRCDKVLVQLTGKGDVSYELNWGTPGADWDVYVFASDKDGTIGEPLEDANSGHSWAPVDAACESASACTNEFGTWETKKGDFYVIEVHYYVAGGGYTLDVSLA